MPQSQVEPDQVGADREPKALAAIYARVSSTGQLGRDGDEDGYSLPAQVEACKKEAISRGAKLAKVYMERAESARCGPSRPAAMTGPCSSRCSGSYRRLA
jgi:hypothetical protein